MEDNNWDGLHSSLLHCLPGEKAVPVWDCWEERGMRHRPRASRGDSYCSRCCGHQNAVQPTVQHPAHPLADSHQCLSSWSSAPFLMLLARKSSAHDVLGFIYHSCSASAEKHQHLLEQGSRDGCSSIHSPASIRLKLLASPSSLALFNSKANLS